MKTTKTWIRIGLVALVLLTCFGIGIVGAAGAEEFDIDEDGVLVRYNGRGGDVVVPDGVVTIGYSAFASNYGVRSVTLPNSVTRINDSAFSDCRGLTRIQMPNRLTELGGSAFNGCTSLTSIQLPDGLTKLNSGVFSGCASLTSIQLPAELQTIGKLAFAYCESLPGLRLPEGLQTIGERAFYSCTHLDYLYIPASVETIGDNILSSRSATVILGAPGSAAQTYAEENDIVFQDATSGEMVFRFQEGKTIQITAVPDPGYTFVRWTSETPGVTFADPEALVTTFVMPASEAVVTAVFTEAE